MSAAPTTQGYIDYDSSCSLVHIPTGEIWARNVSGSCNNFEAKYRSLNPYDVKNTLEKMSEKRLLVAAVLIGTAASDQFTQDIESMPYLVNDGQGIRREGPSKVEKPKNEKPGDDPVRMATKKQVAYIKGQVKKKGITRTVFVFESLTFPDDAGQEFAFILSQYDLEVINGKTGGSTDSLGKEKGDGIFTLF